MSEEKETSALKAPAYDAFFRLVVEVTDKVGEGFSVVINLGGSLITGQMISGRVYFGAIGDLFAGGAEMAAMDTNDETADPDRWREIFEEWADAYPNAQEFDPEETVNAEGETRADGEEAEDLRPTYFHLRNARMVSGPTVLPSSSSKGFLWRGKISSVDGFAFGGIEDSST